MSAHIRITSGFIRVSSPRKQRSPLACRRVFLIDLCADGQVYGIDYSFDYGDAIMTASECADSGDEKIDVIDEVVA